ncbi:MAG TPA: META domain-containing protein [Edaphocola sp.]|nr:META domain-containing protein [Edaphocola sp.]
MQLSVKTIVSGVLMLSLSQGTLMAQPAKAKSPNLSGVYFNGMQELSIFKDMSYLYKNGNTQTSGFYKLSTDKKSVSFPEIQTKLVIKKGNLVNSSNNSTFSKTGDLMEENNSLKVDKKLLGGKWVLTTLHGKKIKRGEGQKQPFLEFKADGTFFGNNGCNGYSGSLKEVDAFRIVFGEAIQTMKACLDAMELETAFMEVIRSADNYTVHDGVLSLNKARMAPMAIFKLVK